jgi:RNA polymerase sigma-70 factor (ECF subfamily)
MVRGSPVLDPDALLMLQVRDDSAEAFEQLVVRYQNRLLTVLEHLCGNRTQAEDLGQEVFLRVFRARKRYVPGAKFSTWLFKIAHNVASNARRSRRRRREVNLVARESGPLGARPLDKLAQAASGLMPTRRLDKAEIVEAVQLAMQSLNERQRMVVLLSKFEEMSYADIADTMGMTTPAIKSLLFRARGQLRTILEPYLNEGQLPPGEE